MKVLALIFNGFEEEEAVAPFALLRRANIDLTIASNNTSVVGSHNITLSNIALLENIDYTQYDALLLPGGSHYKFLQQSKDVHNIIKHFIESDKYVFAICASPTILGELGYLENKKYTCFTSMNNDFKGFYTDKGVEKDGKIITAKSVAYSIEFAYEIIKTLLGENKLKEIHQKIYYN